MSAHQVPGLNIPQFKYGIRPPPALPADVIPDLSEDPGSNGPVHWRVAQLINGVRKVLTGSSTHSVRMRSGYLVIMYGEFDVENIHPPRTDEQKKEDDDILKAYFKFAWPTYSTAEFPPDRYDVYGITTPVYGPGERPTTKLNKHLCDAYVAYTEFRKNNIKPDIGRSHGPKLELLLLATIYHELAHAFFGWATGKKITPRYFSIEAHTAGAMEPDKSITDDHLPDDKGESGYLWELKVLGGVYELDLSAGEKKQPGRTDSQHQAETWLNATNLTFKKCSLKVISAAQKELVRETFLVTDDIVEAATMAEQFALAKVKPELINKPYGDPLVYSITPKPVGGAAPAPAPAPVVGGDKARSTFLNVGPLVLHMQKGPAEVEAVKHANELYTAIVAEESVIAHAKDGKK